MGSAYAFQTILLINRIPLLGESHKKCTKRCSSFSWYNGTQSFNLFQYPHTCSHTQAFLQMQEDFSSMCPSEMYSLWKFVQECSILMCQYEQRNERFLAGMLLWDQWGGVVHRNPNKIRLINSYPCDDEIQGMCTLISLNSYCKKSVRTSNLTVCFKYFRNLCLKEFALQENERFSG